MTPGKNLKKRACGSVERTSEPPSNQVEIEPLYFTYLASDPAGEKSTRQKLTPKPCTLNPTPSTLNPIP